MKLEWDERKRRTNIRKHGLDFVEVVEMFAGPMLTSLDIREDYGEDRWIGMAAGRALVVTFTERDGGKTIHIVSLRKALSYEREAFEKIIFD